MSTIEELIDEFQDLDEQEAVQVLDELGRELPEIPDAVRRDEFLVPGCQSRVWLVAELDESGRVRITADSDAIVVKGLVYVTLSIFDGRTPQEVLDTDFRTIFDRLGVGRLILPQRKNGLHAMVKRIRTFAAATLGVSDDEAVRDVAPPPRPAPEPTRLIAGIRSEFPILTRPLPGGQSVVYLDSGASAQKPECVIAKEQEVEREYFANAFRGRYYFGSRVDEEIERTRESVRRFINARSTSEIVFTSGTTMSINLVALGWAKQHVRTGDEIVLTEMEHHANLVPWQIVAKERGAVLKYLPMTSDRRLDEDAINAVITDRCRLVAVSSMSNVLGTITPITAIVARAREVGARVLVDAAQSVPHAPADVGTTGVDFLCFSGHKLYGPTGVGILYASQEAMAEMTPVFGGGHMIRSVGLHESEWADPPARFEAGTMPIVQIIAMGTAIEFVESLGYEAIRHHEHALLEHATSTLEAIRGLTIYGPALEHKGAIISFSIDGLAPEDLASRLDRKGVFTRHGHHCAMPLHRILEVPATTRATFAVYNTREDVDRLAAAIEFAIDDLSS